MFMEARASSPVRQVAGSCTGGDAYNSNRTFISAEPLDS